MKRRAQYNAKCRMCGRGFVPYRSQGADVGDTQMCYECTDKAMGRHIAAWEYSPQAVAWAKGQSIQAPPDQTEMIKDPTKLL